MKISYNWLKQFIDLDWSAEKTGELLTDLGLEVEGIESYISVIGGLEGVVAGKVIDCEKHPNADKLKVTKVDIGNGKLLDIVCGAPNVASGQIVPVATVGTTLYDTEGNPWKIKKGKIRGEVSEGMICAEDELGLGQSHDGIMVLDSKIKPGTIASDIFEIEHDQIFEIGLTPNRADAMSHWGVARDLKAGLKQQDIPMELITPSTSSFHVDNRTLRIDVNVADHDLAPRYCGVTISDIKVSESPTWLKNKLRSIGHTPINNIVDITNYVLHELGQPLHAFDAAKIVGDVINVKTVSKGTKFVTLDGVERKLDEEDLMICDGEKPMCIAGVFGGIESGVTEDTTSIFLESAYFNPISIRKTAKRHGLNTDASFRFERGIDPNSCVYAMLRAAILITEIAGGEISSDKIDVYPKKIEDHQVFLNFDSANRLIGEIIPKEIIKSILTSLEIKVINVTEGGIGMSIPAYRNDVTREADVIEEILRVYGYNNVQFTEKLNASVAVTTSIEDHVIQNKIGTQLASLGFHEMMGNSLTSAKYLSLSNALREENNVNMLNPLSQDLSILRQTMLFGALEALSYNRNRKISNVKFFEFGKTYHKIDKGHAENKHLSIIVAGSRRSDNWNIDNELRSDFFFMKGVVEAVLEKLGIKDYSEFATEEDLYSEGISFKLKNTNLVDFGLVANRITEDFDITDDVFYADFNWDEILKSIPLETLKIKSIPKFPKVKRDFALLIDDAVSFDNLKQAAYQTERKLLKEVTLFDVYNGENLPDGKKSYALSFTIQDDNKTLTDKQIDKIMGKLQAKFEKDFGAVLR